MVLSEVADVEIDPNGTFKYILIEVTEKSTKEKKYIVRGFKRCHYHADIFDETRGSVSQSFKLECPGGGRISHAANEKKINVYGYSVGFGRANHEIAVDILKKAYPDYEITWSNEDSQHRNFKLQQP